MEVKDNETVDLRSLFISYLSHWKLIGGAALCSLAIAIAYLVIYPTTFETTAQILVQDDKDTFSSGSFGLGEAAGLMKSFGLGGSSNSAINLDDEFVTITSNQLFRDMVERLGLYVDYMEPYTFGYRMYKDVPLKISADSATLASMEHTMELDIHHHSTGKVHVDAKLKISKFKKKKSAYDLESLPATIKVGPYDLKIEYAMPEAVNSEFELETKIQSPTSVAEGLVEEFHIEDYSKSSNVLQISCLDYEKQRAKDMLSTLILCYNEQAENYKKRLADRTLLFINSRLEAVLGELAKSEEAIESYKNKNKITMVEYDVQMYAAAMQEIQTKLIELESQSHLIQLMNDFVHDPQNKYKLVPSLYSPAGGESGDLTSYNQILIERERVIRNSSEKNPMVTTLSVQADRMRESVYKMIDNAQESLAMTKGDLKDKERQLMNKISGIPQQERIYVDLKRQQEIYQGVYLVLLQKKEDIELTIGQGKERARILDVPYTKTAPVAPRKLFAAIGIIAFTLFVSAGWLSVKYIVSSIWEDLKKELKK